MTGVVNYSIQRIQISAAGETNVSWMFYGFDNSGNMNYTDVQSFTVQSRSAPPSAPAPTPDYGSVISKVPELIRPKKPTSNLSITPSFLRVSLKQGQTKIRILKITNIGESDINIKVHVVSLQEFAKPEVTEFNVGAEEKKDLTIEFTAKEDTPIDIYFGKIIFRQWVQILLRLGILDD